LEEGREVKRWRGKESRKKDKGKGEGTSSQ
jgi:hypothetical protein